MPSNIKKEFRTYIINQIKRRILKCLWSCVLIWNCELSNYSFAPLILISWFIFSILSVIIKTFVKLIPDLLYSNRSFRCNHSYLPIIFWTLNGNFSTPFLFLFKELFSCVLLGGDSAVKGKKPRPVSHSLVIPLSLSLSLSLYIYIYIYMCV